MICLSTFKPAFVATSLIATAGLSASAQAQHAHSDIEFDYVGGKIEIEFDPAEGQVFEADLDDGGSTPQVTGNPGFDSEEGANGVEANHTLKFNILGPLLFHDGENFEPLPTGAYMSIVDQGLNVLNVDGTTTSGSGTIGDATTNDSIRYDIHAHINFKLEPLTLTLPGDRGAYGLLMNLSSVYTDTGLPTPIADSDPFYLVFNFGLEEDESQPEPHFHEAVEAFAALVPEPSSLALLGLGGLLAARRRRA